MDFVARHLDTLRLIDLGATISIAAYLWFRRRYDRNAARIGEIEAAQAEHSRLLNERLADGDKRLALLEEHLPTREQVTALATTIAGVSASVKGVQANVQTITSHLLKN